MKVTMEWLREFTPLPQDTAKFAASMTMSGSKVESVTNTGGQIAKISTGRILAITQHPDADRLVICQVDLGDKELTIVTGASNVQAGDIVPVALHGAVLADGSRIKRGKIRGQVSEGMLCSIEELGYTNHDFPDAAADGIYILPPDTQLGQDIRTVLFLDDEVIEFEITSNRVDCFSVEGLAREAAASLELPFNKLEPQVRSGHVSKAHDLASISITAPDLCQRYCGRVVKDIKIGPSPAWLCRRLRGAGLRPINNLVDITNYVLLELGQPMHAFDLDQLAANKIIVRRAKPGEKIKTLDGNQRQLDENMLVIADQDRAVAIAGVMGGENSEVTENTSAVLLESATFSARAVRRASRQLGLRTDASALFEKGLDSNNAQRAIDRACQLIEQLGAGTVCPGLIDVWPEKKAVATISFSARGINSILGTELTDDWLIKSLARLEIPVSQKGTGLLAQIPSWRPDLQREVDLAEEAARLYGYNNIEPSLLSGKQTTLGGLSSQQKTREKVKDLFLAAGFFEACTYSFESPRQLDKLLVAQDHALRRQIRLKNPLGEDYSCMRSTMLPSLLNVAATNWSRSVAQASIFEIGFVYQAEELPLKELPVEERRLAGFLYDSACSAQDGLFFKAKGILSELFTHLKPGQITYQADQAQAWLHPGRTAALRLEGELLGYLGQIHPDVAANFACPPGLVAFELNLDLLSQKATAQRSYQALAKFPAVSFDLALLVPEQVPAGQIADLIRQAGGSLLEELELFDVYQGPQVEAGHKSLAYQLLFRASDKTLSDKEVAGQVNKILELLGKKASARLR